MSTDSGPTDGFDIAIIGMSGRFPGAPGVKDLWRMLCEGREGISRFSAEELLAAGVPPSLVNNEQYVRARGILDRPEYFDAGFFGYSPREAEAMDPQQRLFLECAWEALEDAGYCPEHPNGLIGVFGGVGMSNYFLSIVRALRSTTDPAEGYQYVIGNDKDFLATRVSYKLDLRGPSMDVQTACSTSLVAVHMACQSLLGYQCDMALAGGVTVSFPQVAGYLYQEGMILSPDGHCRAFDADARGTLPGNGVALVLLKRLADALADRDRIIAVIKATACNNDGAARAGYTAPSLEGQAAVIAAAQALANVQPDSIGYIEAHGTGTPLGDPIEVAALTKVFKAKTERRSFCAIGSVKTNVGHLDAAAGVTGLIKAALALSSRQIPPSLHYQNPNPVIDFSASPFYVNTRLAEWPSGNGPRRAGVSSFGIGGTNAHVVLEEAPVVNAVPSRRPHHLLLLSARSASALEKATDNLAEYLRDRPEEEFADIAYTSVVGRRAFNCRRMLVAGTAADAAALLAQRDPRRLLSQTHAAEPAPPRVVFMFSGQGSQYAGMARGVYETEPFFRDTVDECARLLEPMLRRDIRTLLFAEGPAAAEADEELRQTYLTQPALFVLEYAMASLLMSWGIVPASMIGHSIGECVAAAVAGMWSLSDALRIVVARGRLMQEMPPGAMLSVPLEESTSRTLLRGMLSLAAVNAPDACVIAGPIAEIDALEAELQAREITARRLQTSHAFHSAMMEPVLPRFAAELTSVAFHQPAIPWVSNLTGKAVTASEAVNPAYWVDLVRSTVRFHEGMQELLGDARTVFVEVGPGQVLATLARRHQRSAGRTIVSTIRHPHEQSADGAYLLAAVGRLWMAGTIFDSNSLYRGDGRRRVPLPTYPFERQRYWLDAASRGSAAHEDNVRRPADEWLALPSWQRADLPAAALPGRRRWLIVPDRQGVADALRALLAEQGQTVSIATAPGTEGHLDMGAVLKEYAAWGILPEVVVYLAALDVETGDDKNPAVREGELVRFLDFARALAALSPWNGLKCIVVTSTACDVIGTEALQPSQALLMGACRVIPQECAGIACQHIDVVPGAETPTATAARLLREATSPRNELSVAYRGTHRWVQEFSPVSNPSQLPDCLLREGGIYLITGGLGRMGCAIARYLKLRYHAHVALVGRTLLPDRTAWSAWLESHPADDPVSQKIHRVRAVESDSGEVLLCTADVSDETRMRGVIEQVSRTFGGLHGVVHGAGEVGRGTACLLNELDEAAIRLQLRAKVEGVEVLRSLSRSLSLDFCLLDSSLAAVVGGIGFAAYAAANAYLDGVAHLENRGNRCRWLSVNWDAWEEKGTGLAAATDGAIKEEEGWDVFRSALSLGATSQVAVSVTLLGSRIDKWRSAGQPQVVQEQAVTASDPATHQRPALLTAYTAPRNELEQQIAVLWQRLLGIETIGVFDNFFELGGTSLMGTQLASQLRSEFKADLPLRSLFEDPTIAGVASIITAQQKRKEQETALFDALLTRVEQLSDDEVHKMLDARSVNAGKQG